MAATLGDFFVNISSKADNRGIKEVSSGLDGLLDKAKKLSLTYLSFKAIATVTNATSEIIKDAAELGRLSDSLGVATDDLEQFGRAFEIVGAGSDAAFEAINAMIKLRKDFQWGQVSDETLIGLNMFGVDPRQFTNDALKNFELIRQGASKADAETRRYFAHSIGLGEKSLRVLGLNSEEWQDIYKTQAKEVPLLNSDQKMMAEKYARESTKARISKDAILREGAIATAPAFTKGAETINKGAKFIDAIFTGPTAEERNREKDLPFSKQNSFYKRLFGWNPITTKISDSIEGLLTRNSEILSGKSSYRKDKKGLEIYAKEDAIKDAVSRSEQGQKTVIINNSFETKTNLEIKEAKDLQNDFTKHAGDIIHNTLMGHYKEASENMKSGVIQ